MFVYLNKSRLSTLHDSFFHNVIVTLYICACKNVYFESMIQQGKVKNKQT